MIAWLALDRGFSSRSLGFALLVAISGGCDRSTPPAQPQAASPSPAAESVGKPPTEAECIEVGEAITKAIADGDVPALDRSIDWVSLNERCTAGIDAPGNFRQDFMKGLEQARLGGKGVSTAIVDAVKNGGSYTLLHVQPLEKSPRLLFRLLLPQSGVNYHEFLLARRPDGKVRAVDLYVFLSGELLSQTYRQGYIQALAQKPGSLIDRLSGTDQKYVKYFKKLGEMGEAQRLGKFAEVLQVYKTVPDDLKKAKGVQLIRLRAAQSLGDDAEYTQSLEDYRTEHPNDASIDILSIDYYFLKKKYAEALACIDRVDQAVQGDPYLQTIRASLHAEMGDLASARADLKKAMDTAPDLIDAYWSLVAISMKGKDYEETLKTLRLIRDKFQLQMGDLTAVPDYKGFVGSPQYQEWLGDGKKGSGDTEAKPPADSPKG